MERRVRRLEVEFAAFRDLAAGEIRRLEREQKALKDELILLRGDVQDLEDQWLTVTGEVASIREQLASGLFPQPELKAYLESKLGETVTVKLPDASLEGVVIAVGSDALQIREGSGELVTIPLSQIAAVV
ncbi:MULTISPECIES: mechanosensitive ion channel domain-containing protein [Paenibacillus]|uniref:mechanosensitive ion channel domain-containing protein n=1 Tax=Paenibacillus TaxID=44249 RepID=UPI0022B8DCA7|nr:mechanosensitive ion channel domain-containing protein [Paenibacillus caseinilyticus]MCZ8520824.1 hypothetical protein [Paenibacillus caseinilyticus]